jgi:hypothetical protein
VRTGGVIVWDLTCGASTAPFDDRRLLEGFTMGSANIDMAVVQVPEDALLTDAEAELATELDAATTEDA